MKNIVELNGKWTLSQHPGGIGPVEAEVPGCVHTDLLAAEKIPDPFYRDNEAGLMWIGESDWLYEREFDMSDEVVSLDKVMLECNGLDTLATVKLNGSIVLEADNMHRTWTADVKSAIRSGRNKISVFFRSPMDLIAERQWNHPLCNGEPSQTLVGVSWVRKEACNFGWDWGPKCLTAGIWRSIRIIATDSAELINPFFSQKTSSKLSEIKLSAQVAANGARGLTADVSVLLNEDVVDSKTVRISGGKLRADLIVKNPVLWWPNGMGGQILYTVKIVLHDADGEIADTWERRVGLRDLLLVQEKDKWGRSFKFRCNGIDFFAKGADWIPPDVFRNRASMEDISYLLDSAADANMNMIRIWGGGIYESDEFYDACDERGLCVWQDFMFACAAYPAYDKNFMANVKAEIEDNVRRIRHHACIALWCGNNELEQFILDDSDPMKMSLKDYSALFDELIPTVLSKEDPSRPYIPGSAFNYDRKRWGEKPVPVKAGMRPVGQGNGANNPESGDAHLWNPWHGTAPFEWFRTCFHRFCSEFGFQSFPEPDTINDFTVEGDRNLTSRIMEFHQRSAPGNGNMLRKMIDWFRMPAGFEQTCWLSQIQQGLAIKFAVEHWRRNMPRCMGATYWQLNDCWPCPSWSSIDSFGRWKALHYMARDFFAPVLISALEKPETGEMEVHLTSDGLKSVPYVLEWRVTLADGRIIDHGERKVRSPVNSSKIVATLALLPFIKEYSFNDILVWITLRDNSGVVVSRNFASFAHPKSMELLDPQITADAEPVSTGDRGQPVVYRVTLTAVNPALWAWVSLDGADGMFSDNFICLEPDTPREILVQTERPMSRTAFRKALRVRSLYDTFAEDCSDGC